MSHGTWAKQVQNAFCRPARTYYHSYACENSSRFLSPCFSSFRRRWKKCQTFFTHDSDHVDKLKQMHGIRAFKNGFVTPMAFIYDSRIPYVIIEIKQIRVQLPSNCLSISHASFLLIIVSNVLASLDISSLKLSRLSTSIFKLVLWFAQLLLYDMS